MTQPGIEPRSPGPLANTLPTNITVESVVNDELSTFALIVIIYIYIYIYIYSVQLKSS